VWDSYKNKKIFVVLKNGRKYSGVCKTVAKAEGGICFITIRDKFDKAVTFVSSEVEVIEEDWR